MPRGGARPGSGKPKGQKTIPRHTETAAMAAARPKFASGRDFALWCLNAPDDEVPMELKARAMMALVSADAKAAAPAKPETPAEAAKRAMTGPFAPRGAPLRVVGGGK